MSMDWQEQDRRSGAPEADKSRISAGLILWLLVIAIVIALVLGALIDRLGTWYLRRRRRQQPSP